MNRIIRLTIPACIAALLSVITVHYFEEALLPVVEVTRLAVYGDQIYSSALAGCEALDPEGEWVLPTTLALTVFGDAQAALEGAFGRYGVEVMPKYAKVRRGDRELKCVADFLLAVTERETLDGRDVRAFRFNVPNAEYGLNQGWVSGLAQGVVGQIFLATYLNEGDEAYLIAARDAGQLMAVNVEEGGVKVEMPNGGAWYEEYAQPGSRPPLVLNGHFLALDFLYWMQQIEKDPDWRILFDSGLDAAVEYIDRYQGFSWSFYDQKHNLATHKYQTFHVRLLDRYSIHDDTGTLANAKNNMRRQLFIPLGIFQRLFTQPSRLLLFLNALCFVAYFPCIWFACHYVARRRDDREADG